MEPGALKPLLPGPDIPAREAASPALELSDGEAVRVYRLAHQLKERGQAGTSAAAAGSESSTSRSEEPRREPPPVSPPRSVLATPARQAAPQRSPDKVE